MAVAVGGGLVGVFLPFLFPAYHGTPLAVLVAGLLGAVLASVVWEGLTL